MHRDLLYKLFCTLFLQYTTHPSIVWGNTYHCNILPVFIKQKESIRIVSKMKYDHNTSMFFLSMKLLKFFQIFDLHTAKLRMKFLANYYHIIYKGVSLLNVIKMELKPSKKSMFYQSYVHIAMKQQCVPVTGVNYRIILITYK